MAAEGYEVCYNCRGHHVSDAEFDGGKLDSYKSIMSTIERRGLAAMTSSFWGRLVLEKGLRYLVEAYKSLNKELAKSGGVDKKLVIAGGGSDTDAFAKELKQSIL